MRYLKGLMRCAGLVLVAACVVSPAPPSDPPPGNEPVLPSGYELAGFEGAIIQAINDTRTAADQVFGRPRSDL